MGLFKLRETRELHDDPEFILRVGHLIGSHAMLVRHLQIYGDEKGKQMGEHAETSLQFFYEHPKEKGVPTRTQ